MKKILMSAIISVCLLTPAAHALSDTYARHAVGVGAAFVGAYMLKDNSKEGSSFKKHTLNLFGYTLLTLSPLYMADKLQWLPELLTYLKNTK